MDTKKAKTNIENFHKLNILVIGDVMIDAYMWGSVTRISPEAPVPVVSCTKQEERMGGAANVALNIKTLGANPILCSVTGNDGKSEIIRNLLLHEGITPDGLLTDLTRPTTIKTRIIGHTQHLLRVDQETDRLLDHPIREQLIDRITRFLKEKTIHAIVFQDYDKGVISSSLILAITRKANALAIPVLVDPKKRNFDNYRNVALFKPNYKEFTEGLHVMPGKKNPETIYPHAREFMVDRKIDMLLLTLSEQGVMICTREGYKAIPAKKREIVDVSGAGDTVVSMAALCLASGMEPGEIAELSNLAGGLVCEKVGVVPLLQADLVAHLG